MWIVPVKFFEPRTAQSEPIVLYRVPVRAGVPKGCERISPFTDIWLEARYRDERYEQGGGWGYFQAIVETAGERRVLYDPMNDAWRKEQDDGRKAAREWDEPYVHNMRLVKENNERTDDILTQLQENAFRLKERLDQLDQQIKGYYDGPVMR